MVDSILDQQAARANEADGLMALLNETRRRPADADLHAEIAAKLNDLGQPATAIGAGLTAIGLAPQNARAQAELGRAFFLSGQVEAALDPCARSITLAPGNLGALVTFSAVLFTLGRREAALGAASEAVAIDPEHFQARANLALALESVGRLDEAEAQSRRALALQPDDPSARHNLAGLRLSRGKLDPESWDLYESRLGLTSRSRAIAAIPRWFGEDVDGKTVLLHAEQGFGDVIQFSRYASLVAARGARVILAVPAPLIRLLEGLDGVASVVDIASLPPFDVFCPIASLPGIFRTNLATIPGSAPYLSADPETADRFRLADDGQLNVGLVWAGNPGFVHDRFRSIPAQEVKALESVPGVRFHNLQKGTRPPFPMSDRMGEVTDFADTAGLIAGLDLVVTVDTAVAHLAGAMGKPVWMLSRFMGCWRWLRDRSDSPWYPSMRIFRQDTIGQWAPLLQEVRAELLDWSGVRGAAPAPARPLECMAD